MFRLALIWLLSYFRSEFDAVRPWRKVYAGLVTSDKLAKVSDAAAFLYTLLLVAQDDTGCYPWTPAKVRALCVNRPWNGSKIASLVKELVAAKLVEPYDTVLHIVEGEAKNGKPNFSREPWYYDESAATWLQRGCKSAATPLQESTADLPLVGEGVGDLVGEGDQVGDASDDADPQKRAVQIPKDFEIDPEVFAWASKLDPPLNETEAFREAEKWHDHHTAKGTTAKDWSASLRTWMRNASDIKGGRSPFASKTRPNARGGATWDTTRRSAAS